MTNEMAQEIRNMCTDELAYELTRPDNDVIDRLYLNSTALSRILILLTKQRVISTKPMSTTEGY